MSRRPRRNRLATLWIVFSLAALLGCVRLTNGLLPKVDESTGALGVPSPAAKEETIGAGDRTLRLGPTVDLGRAVVPASGGTARIDAPDDPMHGLALEIPPDAYSSEVDVQVSYRSIEGHSLGERFVARSPLIEVETSGGYAARTVQLTIPAEIPEGEVPVALTFAPGSERLEAMRVLAKSASSVTVGGRRIGNVVLTSIDEWFLFEHNFSTGFKHGVDSWQFTNWGAYPSPEGNCTGMTMSAMAYYWGRRVAQGKPPLFGLYDNHDNPFYATRQLEADDRLAIRLVSLVQTQGWRIQEGGREENMTQEEILEYVLSDDVKRPPTPLEVYDAIASAMFFTDEPQLVAVRTETSGHALVAYKKVGNSIYLSDPNHPNAAEGADKIVFHPETGQFEPYMIGDTPFPRIVHLGATSDWDMALMNSLWEEFDRETVGEGAFPAYTIIYAPPDGSGIPLENNMEVYDDELWFRVQAIEFTPRVTLYVESAGVPRQVDQAEGNERVRVAVRPGVIALGFLVEATMAEGASYAEGPGAPGHTWVDYRWFNVLLQEAEATPTAVPTPPAAQWTVEQCNALPALTFTTSQRDVVQLGTTHDCVATCSGRIDITTEYSRSIAIVLHQRGYDFSFRPDREVWSSRSLTAGSVASFQQLEWWPRNDACKRNVLEHDMVVAVYGVPECAYLHQSEAFLNGDPTTLGLPVYVPENPCRAEGGGAP